MLSLWWWVWLTNHQYNYSAVFYIIKWNFLSVCVSVCMYKSPDSLFILVFKNFCQRHGFPALNIWIYMYFISFIPRFLLCFYIYSNNVCIFFCSIHLPGVFIAYYVHINQICISNVYVNYLCILYIFIIQFLVWLRWENNRDDNHVA